MLVVGLHPIEYVWGGTESLSELEVPFDAPFTLQAHEPPIATATSSPFGTGSVRVACVVLPATMSTLLLAFAPSLRVHPMAYVPGRSARSNVGDVPFAVPLIVHVHASPVLVDASS